MKVQLYEDRFIEEIAGANFDAWVADLRSDPQQTELAKSVRQIREAESVNHFFDGFEEEMQLAACGRTGTTPRLRTERPEPEAESAWRVGDDPDKGL